MTCLIQRNRILPEADKMSLNSDYDSTASMTSTQLNKVVRKMLKQEPPRNIYEKIFRGEYNVMPFNDVIN